MAEAPLEPDALSETSLRELARTAGLTLDHPGQLALLTADHSLDVQAAPGSGKTTLTALKLCAMARGWRSREFGVCVLSHTNTAKDQIRERLRKDRWGRTFLRAPHFVGTIQSFVDTYLALPQARGRNLEPRIIDNETYREVALKRLQGWRRFRTLRSYLSRIGNGEELAASATYRYEENLGFTIAPERGSLPFAPTTSSGKQYVSLKDSMSGDGYFRFADMYAFAHQLLHEHPEVRRAVGVRFPWIIIDEMQDTDSEQQDLLARVFNREQVVVQRIGDENQRIFGDVTEAQAASRFPRDGALELPVSLRFGSRIARVVEPLTRRRPQEIEGNPLRETGHTLLILFDEVSATSVVPAFFEQAQQLVGTEELDAYPLKAVGGRIRPSTAQKFPRTILSYAPDIEPRASTRRTARQPSSLIGAVRQAQRTVAEGEPFQIAVSVLWDALAQLVHLQQVRLGSKRLTGSRLSRLLRRQFPEWEQESRELIRILLEEASTESAATWETYRERALTWSVAEGSGLTEESRDFCSYSEPTSVTEGEETGRTEYPLTIDTIHNVKGETHSGTLILECLDHTGKISDLPEALSVIAGTADPKRLLKTSVTDICQLVFVGASRPRSLLAFAVLADHAAPFLDRLTELGWHILDVRHGD